MSEDEEIIIKGNSLDNYLTDLGYADFEKFELENKAPKRDEHFVHAHQAGQLKERIISDKVSTYKITEHEYRKLKTILNSQLLLKEDAHVIDSVVKNAHVYRQRTNNYVFHTSVIAVGLGLLSSALLLKNKSNFYIVPVGLSILFSSYSFWQYSNEIKETKKDVALETHINDLKNLCLNILQFIRFINETEVLSTTQFPGNNRSGLYVSSSKFELKELDLNTKPELKTLLHLRKCLSDVVEEALSLISTSVSYSKQYDRPIELDNNPRNRNSPWQNSHCFSPFSVTELKSLISTYLTAQSEYLTKVALTLSSLCSENSSSWHSVCTSNLKFAKDDMFENFNGLHKKLSNMSFKLNMQHNIHNIPPTVRQIPSENKCFISKSREIIEMQNGVHNVFLLLYSTLLRVRSLEDTLGNLSKTNSSCKSTEWLTLDLIEHMATLKDDFKRTMRCYEVLCQQATLQTIAVDHKQQSEDEGNETHHKVKETGIVVGNSDFTVGSHDEVFLSLSGVNDKEVLMSENLDDEILGRQPQIPKSLLSELAHTLKSRKVNFMEREKQALKKKGLEDIDDLSVSESSDSSDKKSEPSSRARNRGQIKYKKHFFAQDSHSSDSDDEMDPFESGAFLTKLKICRKYQSDPYSDTDSSIVEFEHNKRVPENQFASEVGVNSSVLAELVASKSQLWGRANEECFSDGSDS